MSFCESVAVCVRRKEVPRKHFETWGSVSTLQLGPGSKSENLRKTIVCFFFKNEYELNFMLVCRVFLHILLIKGDIMLAQSL